MSSENLDTECPPSYDVNHNEPVIVGRLKSKGTTSIRKLHYWSNERVLLWLKKCCNQQYHLYQNLFKEHEITGQTLLRLTDYKLCLMGIDQPSHREELLLHVMKLRMQYDAHELRDLRKCKSEYEEDF